MRGALVVLTLVCVAAAAFGGSVQGPLGGQTALFNTLSGIGNTEALCFAEVPHAYRATFVLNGTAIKNVTAYSWPGYRGTSFTIDATHSITTDLANTASFIVSPAYSNCVRFTCDFGCGVGNELKPIVQVGR